MQAKKTNGSGKTTNGSGNGIKGTNEWRVKVGLAEMLKGGVIMDVTNAEQARIAEKSGACAVMALERVPSDIRKEGGVARPYAQRRRPCEYPKGRAQEPSRRKRPRPLQSSPARRS